MLRLIILFIFLVLPVSIAEAKITFVKANNGGGTGQVQFVVPAIQESVRKVLDDDKIFIKFIPGIKRWQVVRQEKNKQIGRCTMSMSRFIPNVTYMVQVNRSSEDELRFKRLSGDLKNLEGFWKLSPGPDAASTTVTYQYSIETNFSHVPKGIVQGELSKHLRETEVRAKNEFQKYLAEKK